MSELDTQAREIARLRRRGVVFDRPIKSVAVMECNEIVLEQESKELVSWIYSLGLEVVEGQPINNPYTHSFEYMDYEPYLSFCPTGEDKFKLIDKFKQSILEYIKDNKRIIIRSFPKIKHRINTDTYAIWCRLIADDGVRELPNHEIMLITEEQFNQQPMEIKMAKEKEKGNSKGELNRHKAMAMGKEIELKKGGKAEKETKKEDRKEKGKEEKKKAKK